MVGIAIGNRDQTTDFLICKVCNLLFRDPCQLSCGHRQCKTCIQETAGETVKCADCFQETSKVETMDDRGFRRDMETLKIVCFLCTWTGPLKQYDDHLKNVHPDRVCEFCADKFDSVSKLEEHKNKYCQKITVPCPLKDYGCAKLVYRSEMAQHYLSDTHQKIIIETIRSFGVRLPSDSQQQVLGMDVDMTQNTPHLNITTDNENVSPLMQEVYEAINILASGIQTLNDDTQRLSDESVQLQSSIESLGRELSVLRLSVEEQGAFLEGVKPNQEILQQDVQSMKQKIDDQQYVSYDGTLIWKITNFREKMTDAQSERQTSIYSPPFFSSPTGYKMRARLYINGDGNARRTHMSLFFVLMRGPNDGILKFPFNYKVTFCLYDQTPQQRHIIDSFRPDIKSNSFQRPRSEMNIASGIRKFFPLTLIEQENNSDIPNALLPYVFSLNPGLPMHVQQSMIKAEAERKGQLLTQSHLTPAVVNNRSIELGLFGVEEAQHLARRRNRERLLGVSYSRDMGREVEEEVNERECLEPNETITEVEDFGDACDS